MAWFEGTYSCGHEGRTQIYGPVKNRQWIADNRFSNMCPDCWEKHLIEERKRKNEEAKKEAEKMELPKLTGSEKQVAWANTIRLEIIKNVEKDLEKHSDIIIFKKEKSNKKLDMINDALNYLLKNRTKASWFIKNRYKYLDTLLEEAYDEMPTEEEIIEQKLEEEIKAEAIVQPEKKIHNKVAEINVSNKKVSVYYPKNDDFYKVIKTELGYSWSGSQWEKKINYLTGEAEDRAAELGNKLLNSGFSIMILDEEIRQKAINADYQPEHHRWIDKRTSGKFKNWFCIIWPYEDDMYNQARSLPESKWSKPNVIVKGEYYIEIQEFAEKYGFKLTPGAKKLIKTEKEKARIIEEKSMKVNPAESVTVEKKNIK